MKTLLRKESRRFKKALELEIEQRRGYHAPGGFVIPECLDSELGITVCARSVAATFNITLEQACFALVAAMGAMAK